VSSKQNQKRIGQSAKGRNKFTKERATWWHWKTVASSGRGGEEREID